ncbi:MAG: MFS transporter [Coxiella sp. (in: Bacteria)]|nr:MAG: MFS transporter [Coxiella sp. (in: g-proteobacteria)]
MDTNKPVTRFGTFCWALFSWAHASFPTVIITFIFSTYFTKEIAHNTIRGTADWGWTMGMSGIAIAILSPLFGSISDHTGRRKPWIGFFLGISVLFTALLWFAKPGTGYIFIALLFVAIANTAYELTQVFYNSMMVSIAPKERIGRISGWAWGFGYFGGLTCLAVSLFLFIKSGWFASADGLNIRATVIFVAAWFLIFALPLFIYTPDAQPIHKSLLTACKDGLSQLWTTLKTIKHHRTIFTYLLAHLLYIDGLNSIFIFAGVFAAGTFHMNYEQILIFAILLNVTAGIGALTFAFIDDWLGSKFTIAVSVTSVIIFGSIAVTLHSITAFWIVASLLGIFVGPTQAASRSFMAHLAPKKLLNQMFGIYQLSGNITAFIGPILVATFTEAFHSQRVGMSSTFGLMFIGLVILLFVPGRNPKHTD